MKRFCFSVLVFAFILTPCFAILEGEVLWTTIEGESIRIIPLGDVKTQTLRCQELYKNCYFNPNNSMDMMTRPLFRHFMEGRLEKAESFTPAVRKGYEYKLRWFNNDKSYAFLEYDEKLGSLITLVSQKQGVIFRIFFTDVPPSVLGKSAADMVDKGKLTFLFDTMLKGEFGK
jgi:hypothetical protein